MVVLCEPLSILPRGVRPASLQTKGKSPLQQQVNAAAQRRMTRQEWEAARRRRKRMRMLRNWLVFAAGCAALVAVMVGSVVPLAASVLAGPRAFAATEYDLAGYTCNAQDPYLALVNGNLPAAAQQAPALETADEASGIQLETAAAQAWRAMAAAAQEQGVSLVLYAGYWDEAQQQAAFDACRQQYLDKHLPEEEADARARTIVPAPGANEHGTGLAADILTAEYAAPDTGFAETEAFAWLCAYAADYGFILRYPEDRQAATGVVFEPWHWRYVGVENARAIAASGLCLEEFLALNG